METTEQTDTFEMLKNSISSLKLMKMSKGYQWEIKIYDEDIKIQLEKIKFVNDELTKLYGGNDGKQ